MSLLPSSPDLTSESEPRVIDLDSVEADELFGALSSETARGMLAALHDDPAPPGELANHVDTSLQNAQYHLEKLEKAGIVEVVGTAYSEKGREMSIYGPADSPLVLFAGQEDRASRLRSAISRLFAGFLALGIAGLVVQKLFGQAVDESTGGGDVGTFDAAQEPAPAPGVEAEETSAEAADGILAFVEGLFGGGLPPGLAFFLGGAIVLTIVVAVMYVRSRP